jgi:hypothetical protein
MMNIVQREKGGSYSEMGASRRKKPLDTSHMTSAVPTFLKQQTRGCSGSKHP